MKKIMFWAECTIGVIQAFQSLGYEIQKYEDYDILKDEEKKTEWLFDNTKNIDIDLFFSFNFIVGVSKWCHENGIKYISWSVDSPHLPLYSRMTDYETNRIFIFDYYEYTYLRNLGVKNIYYFPLATDVVYLHDRALSVVSERNITDKYIQDIAFMGNLYDKTPHNMYDQVKYLPEYVRGYIDGLLKAQTDLWGMDLFKTDTLREIFPELQKYIKVELENKYQDDIYMMFVDRILCMKSAQIERIKMCELLSDKYDFSLYSGSDTSCNKKIRNKGYINYLDEMPCMFNRTKININLNLHCISTGIPLRVLDILACEGFCLTNYQTEIEEYFEDGKDLVIYTDFDDMCSKIDYYLSHDQERKQIAQNGYNKVREKFDYRICIPKMMEMIHE